MLKVVVLLVLVSVSVHAGGIDASSFGVPDNSHQSGFGAAIPLSSGLADEGQQQLQLVDAAPVNEEAESANHVKDMFSNAFNSIRAQRTQANADAGTQTA